ncbi:hypothetical protein ABIB95_000325 [Bradyrhizobium sp. LA2.1]
MTSPANSRCVAFVLRKASESATTEAHIAITTESTTHRGSYATDAAILIAPMPV